MSRRHLGTFPDFDAVWKKYPAGGLAGDTVSVADTDYDWDDVHKQWRAPDDTGARITQTVDGDLDVFHDLTVGGKIRKDGFDNDYVLLAGGGVLPLAQLIIDESDIDEHTVGKYLSKLRDDVAAGKITFQKGFATLMAATFGSYLRKVNGNLSDNGAAITPDGTGDFVNLIVRGLVRGNLTVEELLSIKDMLFTGTIRSKDRQGNVAREGFTDGYGIFMDAARGLIEADGMNIRGFLRVMELIINRLQLMESDYSFTEGGTVEHVDITQDCQKMVFKMHKKHDNDLTPFYYGDIIYAKVNDLLSHGSYYTVWGRVWDMDFNENTLTVIPYVGRDEAGAIVPGGTNFTPKGGVITTEYQTALESELAAYPDGYDTQMNITRHGNVADGIDPSTGLVDERIKESQKGRQQAWVLSTTDKRLTFFWNVDQPIIREDNYSLCLGILPDLSNLPSTRDKSMPSLYINTLFYEHMHHIHYLARIIKEDRGAWTQHPTAEYEGETISEPYHCNNITQVVWLTYRNSPMYASLTDEELLEKMLVEWHLDRETSRVWNNGKLWECMVEGTEQEPLFGSSDWRMIAGDTTFYADFAEEYQLYDPDNFQGTLTLTLHWGNEDIIDKVLQQDIVWTRYTEDSHGEQRTASDTIWNNRHDINAWPTGRRTLTLHQSDLDASTEFPSIVRFRCDVTIRDGANGDPLWSDYVEMEYNN